MKAGELIQLQSVRDRLRKPAAGTSPRALRRLTALIVERQRLMDVLTRLGLQAVAGENLYPRDDK